MVTSFTGGVLTITLGDGSKVSGAVTSATEIECTSSQAGTMQADDQGSGGGGDNGGSGGGDNGGSGGGDNNGQGDDNGDLGDEQGGNPQICTTAALAPGTLVQEAELSLSSAGAVWDKVDLMTP